MDSKIYDIIIVGAGTSGLIAAVKAVKDGKNVLLVEQLNQIGKKLKATGGGRCNLTNTLSKDIFIEHFGKNGRFIKDALDSFSNIDLVNFFDELGVQTHSPDGFRVFPTSHDASTIIDAFKNFLDKSSVEVLLNTKLNSILLKDSKAIGITTTTNTTYYGKNILLATGGLGYPNLGATGESFFILKNLGHSIVKPTPAMMPLFTQEKWMANCTANTIPKVTIKIDIKKYSKIKVVGDLIFTKKGLRGPAILDIAKYINPILDKKGKVPIKISFTNKNEDEILSYIKTIQKSHQNYNLLEILSTLIPSCVVKEFFKLLEIDFDIKTASLKGVQKTDLIKYLSWTPFTIIGNDGFKNAMITTGGVKLKEIDPKTMQSRIIENLYFAGELIDIDGPCGGYNLQWAFSSGYLAVNSMQVN